MKLTTPQIIALLSDDFQNIESDSVFKDAELVVSNRIFQVIKEEQFNLASGRIQWKNIPAGLLDSFTLANNSTAKKFASGRVLFNVTELESTVFFESIYVKHGSLAVRHITLEVHRDFKDLIANIKLIILN